MKNHTIKKKLMLGSATLLVAVMLSACNSGEVSNVNLDDNPAQNDSLGSDPAMDIPGDDLNLGTDKEVDAELDVPESDANSNAVGSFDEAENAEFDDAGAEEIEESVLPEIEAESESGAEMPLEPNANEG